MNQIKYCIVCGCQITGQGNKFCKRECYDKYRIDKPRPEFAIKIKKIMLEKGESYKGSERAKNISLAKAQSPLTEEEWTLIKKTKEIYPWITNVDIFIKKANLSRKLKSGLIKEVALFIKEQSRTGFFGLKIQKWDIEKFNSFKTDICIIPWDIMLKKYEITKKEFHSLRNYFNIKNYVYKEHNFYNTKPEQMFEKLLLNKKLEFIREKYVNNNRWRIDFVIENEYYVEINGDYWHANPRSFTNKNKLTITQKNNIVNDNNKKNFILSSGKKLIYIWEMDLYNKIDSVEAFLEKLLQGEIHENFIDSKDF